MKYGSGGQTIYDEYINKHIDRIYLTEINAILKVILIFQNYQKVF